MEDTSPEEEHVRVVVEFCVVMTYAQAPPTSGGVPPRANEFVLKVDVLAKFVLFDNVLEVRENFGAGRIEGRPLGLFAA